MKVRTKLIGTIAVGAALLAPVAQAQSPDDRPGPRSLGAVASTQGPTATHPDDRSGIRGPAAVAEEDTGVGLHPDDRPGARGPGAVTAEVVQPGSTGFDWDDALIGGLGGAGIALLLTGCAFLFMSQRTKTRTA